MGKAATSCSQYIVTLFGTPAVPQLLEPQTLKKKKQPLSPILSKLFSEKWRMVYLKSFDTGQTDY